MKNGNVFCVDLLYVYYRITNKNINWKKNMFSIPYWIGENGGGGCQCKFLFKEKKKKMKNVYIKELRHWVDVPRYYLSFFLIAYTITDIRKITYLGNKNKEKISIKLHHWVSYISYIIFTSLSWDTAISSVI